MKKFLTGLAVGVAISYLTAPRAGKDTRKKLSQSAGGQTDGLKGQWEGMVAQAKQLLDTVMMNLGVGQPGPDQNADQARTAKERVKEEYNKKVDDTADAAQASVNKAEEALKL